MARSLLGAKLDIDEHKPFSPDTHVGAVDRVPSLHVITFPPFIVVLLRQVTVYESLLSIELSSVVLWTAPVCVPHTLCAGLNKQNTTASTNYLKGLTVPLVMDGAVQFFSKSENSVSDCLFGNKIKGGGWMDQNNRDLRYQSVVCSLHGLWFWIDYIQ